MNLTKTLFKSLMSEVNQRMSSSTAFETWVSLWHTPNMEIEAYAHLFDDTCFLIREGGLIDWVAPDKEMSYSFDIAQRIFYILSTTPKTTISLAALASKLDVDCPKLSENYEENMQLYSDILYHLRAANIFQYTKTPSGYPILIPIFQVKGEVRELLDAKFAQALPQLGGVIEEMDIHGHNLLPGIRFKGMSTNRRTPLNAEDRKIISLISRQQYFVDMHVVNLLPYYVPTISENGDLISPQEQEDTRASYYRFIDMAQEAAIEKVVLQLPTMEDSRGRFYNMATDPAVRLSLRSITYEGALTIFEIKHLEEIYANNKRSL